MYRKSHRYRWLRIIVILAVAGAILLVGGIIVARKYYDTNLKPVSSQQSLVEVTIEEGSTLPEISKLLKDRKLIRNKQVFEQYVRNNGADEAIKAGTYEISPSYGVPEIVSILTKGKIVSKLVTILPGARIDQVKTMLINAGFSKDDAESALNPSNYTDHPALVDKPKNASLEGYLYPESFERTSNTSAKQIINASLDEMQKRLTPELRQAFNQQGLTTHQAVILASIVEREVSKPEDRAPVAQVFLKRIKMGMKLQSDATASYGAVLNGEDINNMTSSQILNYNSGYNTYLNTGLPPGPISNVSEASLKAVANPAQTDWLYFVSGDDKVTYFSKTLEEHEALVQQHCKTNCGN